MSTPALALPGIAGTVNVSRDSHSDWWRRPSAIVSFALHGIAIAVLIVSSRHANVPVEKTRTIELVLTHEAPPKLLVPPKPVEPPKPQPVQPQREQPHVVPRVARPVERPLTVPTTAEKAEVAAPPVTAAPADTPPAPATSVAAPTASAGPSAAPSAPHVVGMEGIPTDYVNQVYERINRHAATSYPRAARMRHLEGRIGYKLTLAPDGSLIKCDIQTSGEDVLDDAAQQAIQAAAPFPKLPDLGGSRYVLTGAIVYRNED